MYDNNSRFLDFIFDTLINEYFDKPNSPADMASVDSRANLDIALKKIASGKRTVTDTDGLTELENAIGDYTYNIEREALRHGLYTGFKAARELLTGIAWQ